MAVGNIKRRLGRKGYTTMSNHCFKNKSLSFKAKGMLAVMLSLPDGWGFSIAGLAGMSTDGESSVKSALSELRREDYVRVYPKRDERGQIMAWCYDVCDEPIGDLPDEENPDVENPLVENQPLLNTNNIVSNNGLSTNGLNEDNFSRTESTSKNISSPKKEKKEGFDLSFVNINFESAFCMWLQHKHDIKDAYKTQQGIEICYQRLLEMSNNDPNIAQKIVEQAIANNWKGLYPLKQNNNGSSSTTTQQPAGGRCMAAQIADAWKASGAIL